MVQGYLARLDLGPTGMRRLFNLWPPFRGAGIRVTRIAPDWREAEAELRPTLLNRNFVGSHFGGSIFVMTDPFCMILMMKALGPQYVVWDKAAGVRFLKPGRGRLTARFRLEEADVEAARRATAAGDRHEPTFTVEVTDAAGLVVARVEKTLYIRRADAYRPALAAT